MREYIIEAQVSPSSKEGQVEQQQTGHTMQPSTAQLECFRIAEFILTYAISKLGDGAEYNKSNAQSMSLEVNDFASELRRKPSLSREHQGPS